MRNFDQAVVEQRDGTSQPLTYDEFFKIPLINRVNMLLQVKVKFFKAGQPISAAEAVK